MKYSVWIPGIIDAKIVYADSYRVFVGNGGIYAEFRDENVKTIGTIMGPAAIFETVEWLEAPKPELPIEPTI